MNAYSNRPKTESPGSSGAGYPKKRGREDLRLLLATLERYVRRRKETGDLAPKPSPGRTPTIGATAEQRKALWAQLEAYDDATTLRHARAPLRTVGERAGCEGVGRDDESSDPQARLDAQKKSLGAPERNEKERSAWHRRVRELDPGRLVFVDDECATNTSLSRRCMLDPREGRGPSAKRPRIGARTSPSSARSLRKVSERRWL